MTPDQDQELERLLAATRVGTEPAPEAQARIRAGIERRLSAGAGAAPMRRLRIPVAALAALIGVAALSLWLVSRNDSRRGGAAAPSARSALPGSISLPGGAVRETVEVATTPARDSADVAAPPVAASSSGLPRRAATKPPAVASDWPSAADELTLIREMQQALRSGNASRALGLAAEHARRFPAGSLSEERESVRTAAQCELDPGQRALLLKSFATRFGTSPYLARVKAACQ